MILVDVHAHLDHAYLKAQLDDVLKRAQEAGVKAVITNGINPETNRESLEMAAKHPIVKVALGIYPIDALRKEVEDLKYPLKWAEFDVGKELAFIEENKDRIVAVGEIGLDFMDSSEEERKQQEEVFRRLIELAKRIDKPVIVHSRAAELRAVEILEESGHRKIVMHCFCGRLHIVKRIIKNGWYFSVPTNVVRSQSLQLIAEHAPLSQLLTETDSPQLSPYKDRRNEPAFVIESVKAIARIKGLDETEVANAIYQNYQRLFF